MNQTYLNQFIEKYVKKTCRSKELAQQHRPYMADSRASAGFRFSIKEMLYPITGTRGHGSCFFDVDNNKYIDITMGYGTLLFGHSYPPIIEAITNQIEQGIQVGPQAHRAGEAAACIADITGVERLSFCNSGTEAVMAAIRLARLSTGKSKIAVFQDSYHGFYDGTLVTANENLGITRPLFAGLPQSLVEDIIVLPYNNFDSLEIIEKNKDSLAGVIIEPVRSRFPASQPVKFLKNLREITKNAGIILIFDEVVTGFRCHLGGAQRYFNIEADLVTYGKIIGGGLPIGVVAGKKEYVNGIDGGYWEYGNKSYPASTTTFFGGTFFKNPLSVAASYAVAMELKKAGTELQENLSKRTAKLASDINNYCEHYELPIKVENFTSLFRFTFSTNLDIFFYHLIEKGIYVWEGRNCFLSQAHSEQDITTIKEAVLESLEDLRKANIITKQKQQNNVTFNPASSLSFDINTFPATAEQKSLWFLNQIQPEGGSAYNEVILINIQGNLELSFLKQSIINLVSRHDALRVQFSDDGEYINFVNDLEFDIELLISKNSNFPKTATEFKTFLIAEASRSFSLKKAPLFSFKLLKFNEYEHTLVASFHHSIIDGHSSDIILSELIMLYESLINKSYTLALGKSVPYSTLLKEQTNQNENFTKNYRDFWFELLNSPPLPLNLQIAKNRPQKKTYKGGHYMFKISKEIKEKIKHVSLNNRSTLFMTLLASFNILIYRYSQQKDFIIGIPISIRNSRELQRVVGFATTVFPIRIPVEPKLTFKDYLAKIKSSVFKMQDNLNFDVNKIVKDLQLTWDQGRVSPLFDIILNMETEQKMPPCSNLSFDIIALNSPFKSLNLPSITKESIYVESAKSKFDISFNLLDTKEEILGSIEYSKDLFEEKDIDRMAQYYQYLLEEIIRDDEKIINTVPTLMPAETKQIMAWNNTNCINNTHNKTLNQLFEEQVKRTPKNTAVTCEGISLTYQELNNTANKLAHYLRNLHQIKSDTLIALCIDRSIDMIVSILTVLKTGGAYVPIDPRYPDDRISYILEDANPILILTTERYADRLNSICNENGLININILAVNSDFLEKQLSDITTNNLPLTIDNASLAYVIYTSGTTGKPKGVMQSHHNVVRLFTSSDRWYDFNSKDVWIFFHSYVFDVSVLEIWGALIYGGKLLIPAYNEVHDFVKFYQLCIQEKVTILNQTPSAFYQFIDIAIDEYNKWKLKYLRYVILIGESLNLSQLSSWFKYYGNSQPKLINMYGPTEATVCVTYKLIEKDNSGVNSIGIHLPDVKTYILDEDLNLSPIGATGELYLGGEGLARGYLNNELLTQERFIANPYQSEEDKRLGKNSRIYKTGDMVRWLSDGELEYIGRKDFQIKIRGYRVELGEIESTITSYLGIKRAVVIVCSTREGKTSDIYLAAYYISDTDIEEEPLYRYLKAKLPEYMVPNVLVSLKSFPLTVNGKLDRKALPNPFYKPSNYVAPRSKLEKTICEIWSEILDIAKSKVGIKQSFFSLGGNSILAMRLVSKINNKLHCNLNVLSIFENNSVEKLVTHLKGYNNDKVIITKITVSETQQRLSFAQERLWFIEKYSEGSSAYNISAAFKISNTTQLDILERSIKAIISRHEILRTLIKEDKKGNSYQVVRDEFKYPLKISKISVTSHTKLDQELEKQVNHVYDLSNEYPIKICLYELSNTERYLGIVIHHIAFDGWSIDIFLKELFLHYNYYLDQSKGLNADLDLPNLAIQYRDFALWQRNYLTGERLNSQLNYWKKKLRDHKTLNLITDKPRPSKVSYKGDHIYFKLSESVSIQLRELAKELQVSLYSLLLAGYYLMLRAYSNQDDIVVGTPIANRHYNQIENLIGFFVNSLALRVKVDSQTSVKEFVMQVWGDVLEAQPYQDLPFEKLVKELEIEVDTSRHPIFQVQFGVQSFGSAIQKQSQGSSDLTKLLQPYEIEGRLYKVSHFDIITFIDDSKIQLTGSFNYATSLYKEETINHFIESYKTILKQISDCTHNKKKQQNIKISDLKYLNEKQYDQIVNVWNNTDRPYSNEKTIQALFEKQVELTPENIAATCGKIKLTYSQLNEKANQLAYYLRKNYTIKPDNLVVMCLDRDEYMLIAMLGILKAGGAYVPIDPSYPKERTQHIICDSNAKLVLTNELCKEKFIVRDNSDKKRVNQKIEILAVNNTELQQQLKKQSTANPNITAKSNNLAYVIYTSGTTGRPKGILMPHQIIPKLIAAEKDHSGSVVLKISQFASISFDVSLQEISYALLNGHELVIIPEDVKYSFDELVHFIDLQQINRLYLPSAALSVLAEEILTQDIRLKNLTNITVSGEELKITPHIIECFNQRPWLTLVNQYGPSETHLVSCYKLPKKVKNWSVFPPIGKPIDNTTFYVLDRNLRPLPIGAIGELYIGGEGIAKGYLNEPELTKENFLANPFQSDKEKKFHKNSTLYKTGDLVQFLSDGNIKYVSREDSQIKIRGYRIELDEIEAVLASYQEIKQSVVLAKENIDDNNVVTNKYLIGYYVSDSKLDEDKILNYLRDRLPEYMLPSALMHLEELPLTINGKLNKKELPDIKLGLNRKNYTPPKNEMENRLCQIWSKVLGIPEDKISVSDDFFRLGGNSILAIRLINNINTSYKSNLKISDIFVYKNIESLLPRITQTKDSYQTIVKLNNNHVMPNMFMIHPGEAGCEVYTSLADTLSNDFSCYGIDSYNLYQKNKIDNVHELAKYYLSYIDSIMKKTNQKKYHFLGWSLGGVISLEIAGILEKRGVNNINLYLLDTILEDEHLSSLMDTINFGKVKKAYKNYQFSRGYDESYVEKIISLVNVERFLIRISQISSTLDKTHVLLFKAMLQDINDISFQTPKSKEIHQHISNLEYNNVDKIIKNKQNMKLIQVSDAYHKNILDKKDLIASQIKSWNTGLAKSNATNLVKTGCL